MFFSYLFPFNEQNTRIISSAFSSLQNPKPLIIINAIVENANPEAKANTTFLAVCPVLGIGFGSSGLLGVSGVGVSGVGVSGVGVSGVGVSGVGVSGVGVSGVGVSGVGVVNPFLSASVCT